MNQQTNIPSKQQIISSIKEQVELKKQQLSLQRINTELAELRAKEVEALAKIDAYTRPTESVTHVLTEQDIKNNEFLAGRGHTAGESIEIPKEMYDSFLDASKEKEVEKEEEVEREVESV